MYQICPKEFLQFILMKNIKYILKLSSLRLGILPMKESIIDQSTTTIEYEQLCHNYIIKQIQTGLPDATAEN
ncbi:unnamed protein product, partial [Adineta steineri]